MYHPRQSADVGFLELGRRRGQTDQRTAFPSRASAPRTATTFELSRTRVRPVLVGGANVFLDESVSIPSSGDPALRLAEGREHAAVFIVGVTPRRQRIQPLRVETNALGRH